MGRKAWVVMGERIYLGEEEEILSPTVEGDVERIRAGAGCWGAWHQQANPWIRPSTFSVK